MPIRGPGLKQVFPLSRQASVVAFLAPRRFWFSWAIAASRWQGRAVSALGGNGALTELVMREHWLRELTRHGSFPIPWRLYGYELLDQYLRKGPVMFYSTHLAMSDMPLRVFIEVGNHPPVPLASPGRTSEGENYRVTGMDALIPALHPGPTVLARMRTVLLRGDSIACLADREPFAPEFSSNPMRLAGRLGVPVFFALGELAPDGVVDVSFRLAPHPICITDDATAENMTVLREFNHRIMRSVGLSSATETATQPRTSETSAAQSPARGVAVGPRAA